MPLETTGLPDAGTANPGWPPHWTEPRPETRHRRGRAGLYVGTALVVLGAIALVDAVVPGWAGNAWFGPALLVALGVALLAGSIHRDGDAPDDRPAAGSAPAAASAGEDSHATPA
jgi:peptidoglycan/LPS O-acetylase OafA/YrhL